MEYGQHEDEGRSFVRQPARICKGGSCSASTGASGRSASRTCAMPRNGQLGTDILREMQIHKLAENVGLALLVGLGYAISGWLSIKLAVPPGYTTPAFPPAGIALSAMLIFGARVWPGILAGALVVQFIAHLAVGISQAPLAGLLIPTFGAVLQAAAGAWLARWLIGFPNRLDSPRTIVRFLVLVAPIGSLVNASLSVPALHAAGIITTQEMAFNW